MKRLRLVLIENQNNFLVLQRYVEHSATVPLVFFLISSSNLFAISVFLINNLFEMN